LRIKLSILFAPKTNRLAPWTAQGVGIIFLYNKFLFLSYYRNISRSLCAITIIFYTINFYSYLITLCFHIITPNYPNTLSRFLSRVSRFLTSLSRFLSRASRFLTSLSRFLSRASRFLTSPSRFFTPMSRFLTSPSRFFTPMSRFFTPKSRFFTSKSRFFTPTTGLKKTAFWSKNA